MINRDRPYLNGVCPHLAVVVLALVLSFAAYAQSGKLYRIGFLETTSATANRVNLDALLRGLKERGYAEGKNLIIDYRSADGRAERFPEMASELARAKPDVIVTRGTAAALAAKNLRSIPVVMATSADPVGPGIVASLARPGGNVTGLTAIVSELGGKRMELLKELLPTARRIGFIAGMSTNPSSQGQWNEVDRAARSLGMEARVLDVRDGQTLQRAFEQAKELGIDALLTTGEALTLANRRAMGELALKHRVPVIYPAREFVEAGGLISYGVHYPDLYYRSASYIDKILKGAKPGDLPIEQPTKLELVINMKAAKALGITIPRGVLLRADEVIE
jgi:putative ABC transport system substrate-binding protein